MALAQVPCAYDHGVWAMYRDYKTGTFAVHGPMEKGFEKRLKWITQCANVAHFRIHHFDYIRGNVSRYFIEVFSIFIPKRYPWGWSLDSIDLAHRTCYYLGTYPNYWNRTNKKIVYSHDLMTVDSFPMANQPLILRFTDKPISPEQLLEMLTKGESQEDYISSDEKKEWTSLENQFGKGNLINYLFPEQMDKETREAFMAGGLHSTYNDIDKAITDMAFFKKKADIIEWLRQKYVLDARKLRYLRCIKVNYAKTEDPQYKILDPEGAKDFPGIPIEEMQLPAPEKAPSPAPRPGERIIRLVVALGVINFSQLSGWSLIVNVEEVRL